MKDLDFDELDRAVNSLIKKTTNTSEFEKDETVLDIPSTSAPLQQQADESTQQSTSLTQPAITPPLDVKPTALAGRRSTGQFMDVVHPSSDMRRTPLAVPDRRPRATPFTSTRPPVQEPNAVNEQLNTAKPNNWPDPIDFQNQKSDNISVAAESLDTEKYEDSDIDKIADEINKELKPELKESQDSPFLSDAKVEKRPLGAFSDDAINKEETVAPKEVPEVVLENEYASTPSSSEPEKESDLPAELQDNLLHIESDETIEADVIVDNTTTQDEVKAVEPYKNESSKIEPITSISQQYKEQPSSGDQASGAIYDTDSYHKSVIRPVKKKSGWLWVLWIAILLVLGAGAGAAIYFINIT